MPDAQCLSEHRSMSTVWRFIPPLTAPGATQMAIDAWLLDQLITGNQPPTLRFYRWQPIAISLGYHQKQWPPHWRSLTWQGHPVELVRRPSGGRAVIHQGDLTYALTLPMQGNRQDLYRQICDALIAAWQRLGVALSYGTAGRGYRDQANCFALATAADLVTDAGYKLIGSAQLRRDRYLLQHGSMRLWPNAELSTQVFGQQSQTRMKPPEVIPEAPDEEWMQHLMMLMREELSKALGATFAEQPLARQEQDSIAARRSQFVAIPANS